MQRLFPAFPLVLTLSGCAVIGSPVHAYFGKPYGMTAFELDMVLGGSLGSSGGLGRLDLPRWPSVLDLPLALVCDTAWLPIALLVALPQWLEPPPPAWEPLPPGGPYEPPRPPVPAPPRADVDWNRLVESPDSWERTFLELGLGDHPAVKQATGEVRSIVLLAHAPQRAELQVAGPRGHAVVRLRLAPSTQDAWDRHGLTTRSVHAGHLSAALFTAQGDRVDLLAVR